MVEQPTEGNKKKRMLHPRKLTSYYDAQKQPWMRIKVYPIKN